VINYKVRHILTFCSSREIYLANRNLHQRHHLQADRNEARRIWRRVPEPQGYTAWWFGRCDTGQGNWRMLRKRFARTINQMCL